MTTVRNPDKPHLTERKQMFYHIDIRPWPRVMVSFTRLPLVDDEFTFFLQDLTSLYIKQRFEMLVDTRNLGMLPMTYLKGMGKWIKTQSQQSREWLVHSCIVVTNPAVRIFVNALFTIAPPSAPMTVCADLRSASQKLGWIA